jgi:hypothetical protein
MKCRGIEVKIVCSNQALVAEVEMDEMWSFVSDKSINVGSGGQSITILVFL